MLVLEPRLCIDTKDSTGFFTARHAAIVERHRNQWKSRTKENVAGLVIEAVMAALLILA